MQTPSPATERKACILIVDDTPENINVLGNTLKNSGYGVIACTNGRQALQVCHSRHPDLVLLDIQMPEMDGFTVCRHLKDSAMTADIPIIFITAKADPEDIVRGFETGAVDYITKPFNTAELLARVRTHLALKLAMETLQTRERQLAELTDQLAEANRALTALSLLDALTGIANRRQFDHALEAEWRRAKRDGVGLGLVLFDIDHFKLYNDTYGHQEGDECLKKVATALSAAIRRPSDTVARYGGEEFAMILPGADREGASMIALEAIAKVKALAIPHSASPTGPVVTITAGVSVFAPQAEPPTIETLLGEADQALYQAKKKGRNQMAFYSPTDT